MKKIVLLTLIVLTAFVIGSFSVSAEIIQSGKCGDNLTWTLDNNGTLTISGTGAMYDYDPYNNYSPLNGNNNIVSVIIEEGVTSIGSYMFGGRSQISNISIPATVTKIGNSAFASCSGLTRVDIPDIGAWCKIDFGMFSNPLEYAKSLYVNGDLVTNLIIPYGVTSIKNYAFYNYSALTSVTIPNSVISIGDYAFGSCMSLASITMGNRVKVIGKNSFRYCTALTSIAIPNSITSIGDYAFDWCNSLNRVDITNIKAWCNITFGASASNPLYHAGKLYLNGELVTNLDIPDGVQCIKEYAFQHCTSLTNVNFPKSVQTIGNYAFQNCTGLKKITIGDNVTSIGQYAFRSCSNLINVNMGNKVELISEYAFYDCNELRYVVIHTNLKYVRNDAFSSCYNISNVFYEGNETKWKSILFYNRNDSLINATIIYNATKKVYKFETNCENKILDITDYAVFAEPDIANNGMIFTGWYDNESLSGSRISFPYYGTATTLYAAWTNGPGSSFDNAFSITANKEHVAITTTTGQLIYFKFIPTHSKEYRFYSQGDLDTYGYLYDNSGVQLTSNDNDGEENNFSISYHLTIGETYYLVVKCTSEIGSFTVIAEDPIDYKINQISISDVSGNELSTIPDETFLATISFTNISSETNSVIVLAEYTNIGNFNKLMYIQTKMIPIGSTVELSIPVDNANGNVKRLKAFCWESFCSLIPMGNTVCFPAE